MAKLNDPQTDGTEDPLEDEVSNDPFHPDNVQQVQLVVLMRIYDVLFGIYKELNVEDAKTVLNIHNNGKIAGPLPWLDLSEDE